MSDNRARSKARFADSYVRPQKAVLNAAGRVDDLP